MDGIVQRLLVNVFLDGLDDFPPVKERDQPLSVFAHREPPIRQPLTATTILPSQVRHADQRSHALRRARPPCFLGASFCCSTDDLFRSEDAAVQFHARCAEHDPPEWQRYRRATCPRL